MNSLKIVQTVQIVHKVFNAYRFSKRIRNRRRRRWWVREVNLTRDEFGFFEKCAKEIKAKDPEHFSKATRMSVAQFDLLLNLLKDQLQRYSRRKPIGPEVRLVLTLMFLAHGCSPQVLAWSFKMGVSTVRKIIYETCDAIWLQLKDVYVAVPNQSEWDNIAEEFRIKTGMPNCIGALDGKHINMFCPRNSGSLFFNYKKCYSTVLLAVCDSRYTFTLIDVGALESQSDGGIFSKSSFGQKILNKDFGITETKILPGTNIVFPYYFVGDAAFPLKSNLMRPYPGRNLSTRKTNFNKNLSKARVYIENSFGILANRWRILGNRIQCSPENTDKIILATVVLHNFLMLKQDDVYFNENLVDTEINGTFRPGQWRTECSQLRSSRTFRSNRSAREAFELRDVLSQYVSQS